MSPRAFLALLVVTAVALAGAAVAVSLQPSDSAATAVEVPMFPELRERLDQVVRVVVDAPGYRLTLEKQGDDWVDGSRGRYPVKAGTVAGFLNSYAALTRVEPKTADPEWYRYVAVGDVDAELEARGTRIIATIADDTVLADSILGAKSTNIGYSRIGATFVRNADDAQAWLTEGSVLMPEHLSDWFDSLFSIPGPELARISVLSGSEMLLDAPKVDFENGEYSLAYLSEEVGPPGSTINPTGIRALGIGAVSVVLDDVRSRDGIVLPEDVRTVRFISRSGLQISARLGEADGETWVILDASVDDGSEAAGEAAEIRKRTENWAFKLPKERLNALRTALSEAIILPGPPPVAPQNPAGPQPQ